MTLHTLGEISLSISSTFYIAWLLPQVWFNYRRKSTEGLSFWLHLLLLGGYLTDLMYGFGLHMQWQYKTVTLAGLACLFIQHIQFYYYGLNKKTIPVANYFLSTIILLGVFVFSLKMSFYAQQGRGFYDDIGVISNICFCLYLFPQIAKNYRHKSAHGLSIYFLCLTLFLSVCDFTSAYALHWDWPSFIGPIVSLINIAVLLTQHHLYERVPVCVKP